MVYIVNRVASMVIANDVKTKKNIWQTFIEPQKKPVQSRISIEKTFYNVEPIEGGVKVVYQTLFDHIELAQPIQYSFFFPDLLEERRFYQEVTPQSRECTLTFDYPINNEKNHYFNVVLFDSLQYMIAADTLVFNKKGEIYAFSNIDKNLSKYHLASATLKEERIINGKLEKGELAPKHSLSFTTTFQDIEHPIQISHVWQNSGFKKLYHLEITPEKPLATSEFILDKYSVIPGFWMVCAVDEEQKFLAETFFTVDLINEP